MIREERLKSDPAWAAEYHRKARERMRRRMADPAIYAETLRKNRERARAKRARRSRPFDPTVKRCSKCGRVKPATTVHFSPSKSGRHKLYSWCKQCVADNAVMRRRTDPDFRSRHVASIVSSHKRRLARDSAYREKVRTRIRDRKRRMRADPIKNEELLAKDRAWRKKNWDRVRRYKHKSGALLVHHVAMRNAAKLRATPPWVDRAAIERFYAEARRLTKETGRQHHVDHIVPLRGRNVCGLHVPANLQILEAEPNKRKSNRLLPEHLGEAV